MKLDLSKSQLDKLSDLALGLGQLFFGSTVVPYIIPALVFSCQEMILKLM